MVKTLVKCSKSNSYAHIPTNEILGAMTDLSPKAFQLLVYYYNTYDGFVFSNKNICKRLDVSDRMLIIYTKELISKGYLLIYEGKIRNIFVGQSEVKKMLEED